MSATVGLDPCRLGARACDHVWYAAYGSNMLLARLEFYLAGGTPPNGARTYPGTRNKARPAASVAVELPGQLYFALESAAWTGGLAFYDQEGPGPTAARAHLLTTGQFSDIAAQEMYHEPELDLDLSAVLEMGRAGLGPGRYETLIYVGELQGRPVLTFTAPWRFSEVEVTKPSAHYLRLIGDGLMEAHAWTRTAVAEYLASKPGAAGAWSAREILELLPPE